MQEKMDTISREINIVRKKQSLEIQALTEMKNVFYLISKVYIWLNKESLNVML